MGSGRTRRRAAAIALPLLLVAALGYLFSAGYVAGDPLRLFPSSGRRSGITALYFSGDSGLRFGMGPATSQALAKVGIPVLGVATSTLFRTHHTRAEVDGIVADAVRAGLARAGRDRLVLIGQSYGADVLQTGLADLPRDLRARIAAIILVVPGVDVFFRADPTGFLYHMTPDSDGRVTARTLTWAPLTCIYGVQESDSVCPSLGVPGARIVPMPGGHFLHRDAAGLTRQVLAAIAHARTA